MEFTPKAHCHYERGRGKADGFGGGHNRSDFSYRAEKLPAESANSHYLTTLVFGYRFCTNLIY